MSEVLLPKTLQSLSTTQRDNITTTISDMLVDDGIAVGLVDLVFGHYFVYVLLSDGVLIPVFLYEERIGYKQFQSYGAPKLHFCHCSEIKQDFCAQQRYHTLTHRHYLARVTKRNAFSFSIWQGASQVGLYNDYPLELCAACSEILSEIREGQRIDSTLSVFIFKNESFHLLQANPSFLQKELTAFQVAGLECYKCKQKITLDSQIWIQINGSHLQVCCC